MKRVNISPRGCFVGRSIWLAHSLVHTCKQTRHIVVGGEKQSVREFTRDEWFTLLFDLDDILNGDFDGRIN